MMPDHNVPSKIDEEIDAALHSLREIQPPEAMQSRIQQSLKDAAEASGQKNSGWLFWIPATGIAIAAILLAIYLPTRWMQKKQLREVETAKITATNPALPDITVTSQVSAHNVSSKRKEFTSAHRRREHAQYKHVANLLDYPLTKQEKLLLKFVQTAKPEDLRDLNPEYQAKVDAQQEAEFEAYLKSGSSSNKRNAENTNQSIQE